MGKFTGCLLITDYDGTFTSNIRENYKKNIEAVERFKSEGGVFTFATGRDYHSLLAIEPEFENIANTSVIMSNGARLYDIHTKDFIFSYTINLDLFTGFLDVLREKHPETGVRFSCKHGMVTPDLNDILKADLNDIFMRAIPIREMSVAELIKSGEEVYKCVMVNDPEIISDIINIAEDFNENTNHEFFFSKTYLRGLEAIRRDASKKSMALKIKEYLTKENNIDYKLFAIGDYDNDLEMIKAAYCGASPITAVEHVRAAAKINTVSCHDGAVADFIRIIECDYV